MASCTNGAGIGDTGALFTAAVTAVVVLQPGRSNGRPHTL